MFVSVMDNAVRSVFVGVFEKLNEYCSSCLMYLLQIWVKYTFQGILSLTDREIFVTIYPPFIFYGHVTTQVTSPHIITIIHEGGRLSFEFQQVLWGNYFIDIKMIAIGQAYSIPSLNSIPEVSSYGLFITYVLTDSAIVNTFIPVPHLSSNWQIVNKFHKQ